MFKKTKKLNPAPKLLTIEQILSDLETFKVPKSEIKQATRFLSPNDPEFDKEWWKLFETFVDDVDQLKTMQETLDTTKEGLTERRREISKMIGKLEKEMGAQKKVIDGIPRDL